MKRTLAMFLTLALLLSYSITPASAKSFNEEVPVANPLFVDTSRQWYTCIKCDNKVTGNQTETWVETSYYYVRLWATMVCPVCGYTWNTMISEVTNTWYAIEPDTEDC